MKTGKLKYHSFKIVLIPKIAYLAKMPTRHVQNTSQKRYHPANLHGMTTAWHDTEVYILGLHIYSKFLPTQRLSMFWKWVIFWSVSHAVTMTLGRKVPIDWPSHHISLSSSYISPFSCTTILVTQTLVYNVTLATTSALSWSIQPREEYEVWGGGWYAFGFITRLGKRQRNMRWGVGADKPLAL
jgi:hypothetical protein